MNQNDASAEKHGKEVSALKGRKNQAGNMNYQEKENELVIVQTINTEILQVISFLLQRLKEKSKRAYVRSSEAWLSSSIKSESKFEGTATNGIIKLLHKFVYTIHSIEIPEVESFVMLPFLLKGGGQRQFDSASRAGSLTMCNLSDWATAINQLIQTYPAKITIISELKISDKCSSGKTKAISSISGEFPRIF